MITLTSNNNPEPDFEYIRRLGIGNKNTLCDSIADEILTEYQEVYIRDYGEYKPCEFEAVRIVGGKTKPEYGGGKIIDPATIITMGKVAPCSVDIEEQAVDAVIDYLNDITPRFDINKIVPLVKEDNHNPNNTILSREYSNEYGYGYATTSVLENLVLSLEESLYEEVRKIEECPIGYDINITGFRKKKDLELSLDCAIIDEYVQNEYEYQAIIDEFELSTRVAVEKFLQTEELDYGISIKINENGNFLTIMGTFAENSNGSSRVGNNTNGVINPNFHTQFVSGMDDTFNVNKIYNRLATEIAEEMLNEYNLKSAEVYMVSEYGKPICNPKCINITVNSEDNVILDTDVILQDMNVPNL